MRDLITDRVIAVTAESLFLDRESITEGSTFESLGIDSLTGLNLIYELEKEFGVEVPNEQVLAVRSVREIVDCLCPLVTVAAAAGGGPAGSPR